MTASPTLPDVQIVAYGKPAPQGSKRHVGRGVMVESSKYVAPWREAVKAAALTSQFRDGDPLDGPLEVELHFTVKKPVSAPRRRRTWPDRTPDLSKLVRATEDALTEAGVWADDARVVRMSTSKSYPGEGPTALRSPGVLIRVYRIADDMWHADIPVPRTCDHLWPGELGSDAQCVKCGLEYAEYSLPESSLDEAWRDVEGLSPGA